MNTNTSSNTSPRQGASSHPAEAHAGIERIERAFENLAERVEAGNERLQRAILQQRLSLDGFELAEVASRAQQAAWERGRAATAQEDGAAQAAALQDDQASLADVRAWANAYRDTPVEETADPLEMHKNMWLDGIDATATPNR